MRKHVLTLFLWETPGEEEFQIPRDRATGNNTRSPLVCVTYCKNIKGAGGRKGGEERTCFHKIFSLQELCFLKKMDLYLTAQKSQGCSVYFSCQFTIFKTFLKLTEP